MNPFWPTIASSLVFGAFVGIGLTWQQFALARVHAARGRQAKVDVVQIEREEDAPSAGLRSALGLLQWLDLNDFDGQLIRAGFASTRRRVRWHIARLVMAIAAPLFTVLALVPTAASPALMLSSALLAFLVFYIVPSAMLLGLRRRWLRSVSSGVPTMLDMMVTAVEAGLGVDAALHHVGQEVRVMSPALAAELDLLNAEVSAGVPRRQALERFAARTRLPSLESLASTLIQVESQGAGIARALRAHAQLERRRRMLDAERRAASASPRMTVVMVLFLIPALLMVLMGPAVLSISDHFILRAAVGGA